MNRFVSWLKSVFGKKDKNPSCASCMFWGLIQNRYKDYGYCICDRTIPKGMITHRDFACLWLAEKP